MLYNIEYLSIVLANIMVFLFFSASLHEFFVLFPQITPEATLRLASQ